jgi:fumarate reductase (CoM/CoB) subunit A
VTLEAILEEHARHDPASTRDAHSRFLERAIIQEVASGGGTPNWGVWIDLRGAEHTLVRYVADWLHYRGIFSDEEMIEASVFQQCSNGGMRVDENAQTSVPGLYAAGECMTGCHGADRLGGNMLGATQVFGARAGRHAARLVRTRTRALPEPAPAACRQFTDDLALLMANKGHERPGRLKLALQQSNWRELLFVRSAEGLQRVLAEAKRMRQAASSDLSVQSPAGLIEALELQNMLVATEIVAGSALARTESRGAHYRVDFPARNDGEWLKVVVAQQVNGGMQFTTRVLDPDWHDRSGDMGKGRWG